MKKITLSLLLSIVATASMYAAQIKGQVVDAKTGEPVIGAAIVMKNDQSVGTLTDIFGNFEYDVNSFPTEVVVSFFGYVEQVISISSEEPIKVGLTTSELTLDNVVVTGRRKTDSDAGLLANVKSANAVLSGISAAQISKTSDSDASEVVKRIPGISIIEDRFIVVRGLAQRYNNVWLNGGSVPSTEADGRAFSFDIIPSGNIDNILISKSFSADLPGDFSGGFIKIITKGMPSEDSFSVSVGTGINSETHFDKMRLGARSSTEWMGFDSNMRPLDKSFPSTMGSVTDKTQLDNLVKTGFNNDWSIDNLTAIPDIKVGMLWNKRINDNLGTILSVNYQNSNKSVIDMENNRYGIYNAKEDNSALEKSYTDNVYSRDTKVSAMNNWIWTVSPKTELEFRNLFSLISRNRLTERYGVSMVSGDYYENQTELFYSSRLSYTGQFAGKHRFADDGSEMLDWNASYSYAMKDEPDRRVVNNLGSVPADGVITADVPAYNDKITRYYQELDEHIVSGAANYKKQLIDANIPATIQGGVYGEYRSRKYTPREFLYRYDKLPYADRQDYIYLPFEDMMSSEWLGIDKVYIDEISRKSNAYDGEYSVAAAYASTTLPVGQFDIYAGVRAEMWNMNLTYDSSLDPSTELINTYKYDELSILPALNVAYKMDKKNILRASYGRTVNRPEFRELSPSVYYDFDLFAEIQGNPELESATIDNLDLRWELYPASGETVSVGLFYKHFENPIEWNFIDMGGTYRYSYENAKSAYTAGVEVDLRKSLDFIGAKGLSLVFNGSYVISEVDFKQDGLVVEKDRPLQGQSPYIINTAIFYDFPQKLGMSAGVQYNIIGKRIIGVGKSQSTDGSTDFDVPDVYEMPRHSLDITLSKDLSERFSLKLGIDNILNQDVVFKQFPTVTIDGVTYEREQVTRNYKSGVGASLSLSAKF